MGYFGFGVATKSDYYTLQYNVPTNYNYMQDWNDLRWKHIDESLGLVNAAAKNTYDNIYYFYYSYYTYTANQNYWSDSWTYDE